MLTGELKAICIKHLQAYVAAFQERRKTVTEGMREEFMKVRPLTWDGNPNPITVATATGSARLESNTSDRKENEEKEQMEQAGEDEQSGKPNGELMQSRSAYEAESKPTV